MRKRVEKELDEELRFHLEQQIAQNLARGMDAREARRQALLALDGLEQCKEKCRDVRRWNLAGDLVKDCGYAARVLRKTPAFAATAVLTIAMGIGACTAIFSVTNAVLLRPLPYRNAGRLVVVDDLLSNARYFDLRDQSRGALEDLAAIMVFRAVVPREDGSAERISKGLVTTNFLPMLGAHVVLGRDFSEADGHPHGTVPSPFPPPQGKVAILSYDYFMRRYSGNRSVLGSYMPAPAGAGPQIVGVLEPGFKLFLSNRFGPQPNPEVWIANDRGYDEPNRNGLMLQGVGVLKAGVSLGRARALLGRAGLAMWQRALVDDARPALGALMGAVVLVLLIACANVANLLLLRAAARERELAVRAALGAGAGRLARQMLAEALLLCGLGTALGVGVAWVGIRELLALAPANLPRLEQTSIDWRVLGFAAFAGLVEAMVLGALPGWRAARPDLMQMLRGAGRAANAGRGSRLRPGVVVAEVALSFVLLVGAGLMMRSFIELRRVEPGYHPHGLLTFLTVGEAQGFEQPQRRMAFLREEAERLKAIPGVESVGAATGLPLHGLGPAHGIRWSTQQLAADESRTVDVPTVLPGYFEVLESRILEGRVFTEADNASRRNLAVIDETLAARAFPNESAVGRQICVYIPDPFCLEVIGVVEHQRLYSLASRGKDQIFLLDGFWGIGISRHWALRTRGDPAKYAAAVRAEVAKFAPGRLAITDIETMDASVAQAQAATRFQLLLIGVFAAMAALLAAVGLYGVLASAVRQRTAEIGVRMALGAAPGGIFRMVVGRGLALSAVGVAIGFIAALGLTRVMESLLVGVRATDPATFAAMTVFFFLVAGVACWAPARRAAGMDTTAALREE